MVKKLFLTTALATLGLAFMVFAIPVLPGGSNAYSAEKVRIATFKRNAGYYLVFAAAEENRYWERNALSAEVISFKSGRSVIEALAAGAIDMAFSTAETAMRATAQGVPLVIVADSGTQLGWHFWVLANSPIKKPADLKGKKIGVTRTGSGSHSMGRVVAKGLGLERDMQFVATGGIPQAVAALRSGVVDAMVMPYLIMAKLKFEGRVRGAVPVSDYLPKPWLESALFATKGFIDKKADAVKATIRAFLQAGEFVTKNRRWTVEKLKSEFGYSEESAKEVHESLSFSKDGKLSRTAVENLANFLVEYGLIPRGKLPPLDDLYTTRFTG